VIVCGLLSLIFLAKLMHHGVCCPLAIVCVFSFFVSFFHQQNGLLFGYLTYQTISEWGDNSDILSRDIEVGGAILECPLNSPFRPSYGHFTNEKLLFFTLQQQASFGVDAIPWQHEPQDKWGVLAASKW
jgi:hypothetical protein